MSEFCCAYAFTHQYDVWPYNPSMAQDALASKCAAERRMAQRYLDDPEGFARRVLAGKTDRMGPHPLLCATCSAPIGGFEGTRTPHGLRSAWHIYRCSSGHETSADYALTPHGAMLVCMPWARIEEVENRKRAKELDKKR